MRDVAHSVCSVVLLLYWCCRCFSAFGAVGTSRWVDRAAAGAVAQRLAFLDAGDADGGVLRVGPEAELELHRRGLCALRICSRQRDPFAAFGADDGDRALAGLGRD